MEDKNMGEKYNEGTIVFLLKKILVTFVWLALFVGSIGAGAFTALSVMLIMYKGNPSDKMIAFPVACCIALFFAIIGADSRKRFCANLNKKLFVD